jgi:uncharacterized membrane protein YfcA
MPESISSILAFLPAAAAAFLLGLTKAGIKGIDIIIVTLLAMVFGAKASTGVMMPLLLAGDVFAVFYYHRHTQWKYLLKLLPWMVAGVLAAVYFGDKINEIFFKRSMAVIILVTAFIMFRLEAKKNFRVPAGKLFSTVMGSLAGFTTMIGNLAGTFSNIYFLAMRLPQIEFIGTAAWLFFIINLFKLPFHIFVWKTINMPSLETDLYLVVFVALGLWVGVKSIQKINAELFRKIVLIFTLIGGVLLLLI